MSEFAYRLGIRIVCLAVLHPWLRPMTRPVARWVLAEAERRGRA